MAYSSLVDDLADLRREIARLRAREADLRARLLAAGPGSLTGRWSLAEVAVTSRRYFDHRLLPDNIRQDPQFWQTRETTVVLCRDITRAATRPGWPFRTLQQPASVHGMH